MANREFFQKVHSAWQGAKASWRNTNASPDLNPDWSDEASPSYGPSSVMRAPSLDDFDPETFTRDHLAFKEGESKNVQWLLNEIKEGRAVVDRGWVYESRLDRFGRPTKECGEGMKVPYKLKAVKGHAQYLEAMERSKRGDRLREDMFGMDLNANNFGPYDPNQYTEYAPIMGGYFFAQQYLYDLLKGFAYAFEAWNHNPLAHRIINALSQYTLGRRFTWNVEDPKKEKVWDEFADRINLVQRMSKFWIREKLIFGEQLLDVRKWRSLHPATVWDIITDPDDFSDVYYYYRSYPTAYQMFSGYKVPSVPGSKDVPAQKYVIEQIPYTQILHTKSQCTSFEKRGRSTLFPILGWLKRIKDIYNNQAIREQMLADYVWDVEVKGGPADVAKFASQYTPLVRPGSTHFHNDAVKRTPMAAAAGAGRGTMSEASNNILAFIATAIGLPKDFFNVIATSGGNRATALVAAEPFTKVVEDEQADWEYLLHKVAERVFKDAELDYHPDDIEFTFPSVTKDTTTETVKNIIIGETQGYISKERAATLFTQEMNITAYDFDSEQDDIKNEQAKGLSNTGQPGMPDGRMGGGLTQDAADVAPIEVPDQKAGEPDGEGDSPIHGKGKVDLKGQMGRL